MTRFAIRLAAFLFESKTKKGDFARKIGRMPQSISNWLHEGVIPHKRFQPVIIAATNGFIKEEDFNES